MNINFFAGAVSIFVISVAFVLIQLISVSFGVTEGMFVVDAISLKKSLLSYDVLSEGVLGLRQIISQVLSFYALLIIYILSPTDIGFLTDFVINLAFVVLSWKNTLKIATLERSQAKNIFMISFMLWFVNPYLLAMMVFPNKEMVLLYLTTSFALSLIKKKYLLTLAIILITYFIRDGHAIALACGACSFIGITRLNVKGWHIFLIAFVLLSTVSINDLSQIGGAFERNAALGEKGSVYHDGRGSNPSVLISSIINWLNFAFRPQFFGDNGLYTINIGFWLLGVATFLSLPIAYLTVLKSKNKNLLSSLLIFSISCALLISSYSQPRYFLPFMPLMLIIISDIHPKIIGLVIGLSLLTYPIMSYLDFLPPLQIGITQIEIRSIGWP